ncbi:MAG: lytic transglycosylase domain-containing protein [Brachymonas sp.]|nr:lytic transglycosylase domain-containing protein [Brachymonas sp.]
MRPGFFSSFIPWLPLLAMLGLPAALADVWGYVDAQGNTHFATRQIDDRYQLYFKTPATPAPLPAHSQAGAAGKAGSVRLSSGARPRLAFNPAADAAAGIKAQRLVALMNQSKAFKQVRGTLQQEALRHGVDVNLVKAITATESGFNPRAVSSAGAVGLMQIMPATARFLGLRDDGQQSVEEKLTDSTTNARLGVRYLQQLLRQFNGRLDLAVAAYNAGPGAVRKRMAIPPYAETQGYVRTVLAIYETLQPGATGGWVAANMGTGATATTGRAGSRSGARRRVVLAGASGSTAKPGHTGANEAGPAVLTLKANALDGGTPSALDWVADKIAAADHLAAPELGDDVRIQPSSATPAATSPAAPSAGQ